LDEPVTLSCGHSLCHRCLKGLPSAGIGRVACPTCRTSCDRTGKVSIQLRASVAALFPQLAAARDVVAGLQASATGVEAELGRRRAALLRFQHASATAAAASKLKVAEAEKAQAAAAHAADLCEREAAELATAEALHKDVLQRVEAAKGELAKLEAAEPQQVTGKKRARDGSEGGGGGGGAGAK